jgi:uncharacterized protein
MDRLTAFVVLVLFFATLVRSTLGFGQALLAVPVLAFVMPVRTAAPVSVLVSIVIGAWVVIQDWDHIHLRSATWLVLATLPGIPIGLIVLRRVPEPVVNSALGLVVCAFALTGIRGRIGYELKDDRWAWLFGFAAGILGGAYSMNGPPLVMYGALRRWSPEHFRATLQGYFLPAGVAGMIGYWLGGLWTGQVNRYFLFSLPAVLLAIPLGRAVNRHINAERFLVYVNVGLLVSGVGLLVQGLLSR